MPLHPEEGHSMTKKLYTVEVIWADTLKHIASASIEAINPAAALLLFSGHGAQLRKIFPRCYAAKVGKYAYRVWMEN